MCEVRIKQLNRGARAALFDCTGGRGRYQEVWGDLYEHIMDLTNHTSYSGEQTPVQRSGGTPVDVEGDIFHVYGAEVLRYIAHERRDGKLDMPSRSPGVLGR